VKIAGYAFLGWTLCFALGPSSSETARSRANRIAADPLRGQGWLIPCAAASWLLASIGVAYSQDSGPIEY
ncbi:MAG TPA: hypothetical protein VGM98_02915, partial [Schlesneria sp.]